MNAFYDEYDMEIDTDNEYWRKAFKKCQGGIAIIPHTSPSIEEMRKYYPNWIPKENANVLDNRTINLRANVVVDMDDTKDGPTM